MMSNSIQSVSKRRKSAWLGAAALAALIVGGAVESGLVPPSHPAYAQAPALMQAAPSMPSFADVVEKVKPAVVSVRVEISTVAHNDDDDDALSKPDFPSGSPMERSFRRFQDGQGDPGRRFHQEPRRNAEAQGSGF